MTDPSSPDFENGGQRTFSRRDFLKLLGVGGAAAAGAAGLKKGIDYLSDSARQAEAGINWETDPYSKIDFVNHPNGLSITQGWSEE